MVRVLFPGAVGFSENAISIHEGWIWLALSDPLAAGDRVDSLTGRTDTLRSLVNVV